MIVRVNVHPSSGLDNCGGFTVYVGRNGAAKAPPKNMGHGLSPGESSPWIDIGRYMSKPGVRSPDNYFPPVLCAAMAEGELEVLCLMVEVSLGLGTRVPRCVQLIGNLISRGLAWVLRGWGGVPHHLASAGHPRQPPCWGK